MIRRLFQFWNRIRFVETTRPYNAKLLFQEELTRGSLDSRQHAPGVADHIEEILWNQPCDCQETTEKQS